MNERTESFSNRLDILERRCSRLRLWCALLSTLAITACLSSALRPTPAVVEAKSFVVLGPNGEVKAKLAAENFGSSPSLELYNAAGDRSASVGVFKTREGEEVAALHLESGKDEAQVFTAIAGENQVGFFVSDDHRAIESWVKPEGSSIRFTTDAGQTPPTGADEEEKETEDHAVMRLDVVGDKPSINGLTPKGDVIFHVP